MARGGDRDQRVVVERCSRSPFKIEPLHKKVIKSCVYKFVLGGIEAAIVLDTSVTMVGLTQEEKVMQFGLEFLSGHWVRDPRALHACDAGANSSSLIRSSVGLCFHVGLKNDHIRVDMTLGCKSVSLGYSELFVVLAELARKRLADIALNRLPESEQGWVDTPDLVYALGLDDEILNVTIFRLRKLFQRYGLENARDIVERRRKQIRIGIRQLKLIEAQVNKGLHSA